MLVGVESHPGVLLGVAIFGDSHLTAAYRGGGGLDEYQRRARARRPRAVPAERERTRCGRRPVTARVGQRRYW